MATRVWVRPLPDYPGVYMLEVESGDVSNRVILTKAQVESLRSTVLDAMATADRERRRRQPA